MKSQFRAAMIAIAAAAVFFAGYRTGQAENKFGTPKTIVHVVTLKWKPDASEADRQKVLEGVKEMAAKIPGIKNVWIKAERVQPREFHSAFAIEFESREAADRYAEDPTHAAWSKQEQTIREASYSLQITN